MEGGLHDQRFHESQPSHVLLAMATQDFPPEDAIPACEELARRFRGRAKDLALDLKSGGWSWAEIAAAAGLNSRQAAQNRYDARSR